MGGETFRAAVTCQRGSTSYFYWKYAVSDYSNFAASTYIDSFATWIFHFTQCAGYIHVILWSFCYASTCICIFFPLTFFWLVCKLSYIPISYLRIWYLKYISVTVSPHLLSLCEIKTPRKYLDLNIWSGIEIKKMTVKNLLIISPVVKSD